MVRLCLQCLLWGCLLTAVHPEPTTECEGKRYLLNHQCCDLCEPGKKLRNDCTEDSPTQCISCAPGEFSKDWNRETRCHQHRVCEFQVGLQVQSEGTSVTDTTCVCREGWHCISPACEKCAPHKVCDPGFGVAQMATGTSDTVCEPCPAGFFSSLSSASEECHPWTSCEAQDQVVLQEGTQHMDVVCGLQPRKRALVAIPIVMSILLAIFLLSVYIRKVFKKKNKLRRKDPVEDQEDPPGHIPATPVQETLHGCQPVTQEDGKESRISVQERQ